MASLDQTAADNVLDALLATASFTASVTGVNVRLTTTAPTATSNGTQLSGTGYTTNGYTVTWNAGSAGPQVATNISTISTTNASGSSWNIVGLEIWDKGGTPARKFWGLWTGQPITVNNGNTFAVAAGAISISLV